MHLETQASLWEGGNIKHPLHIPLFGLPLTLSLQARPPAACLHWQRTSKGEEVAGPKGPSRQPAPSFPCQGTAESSPQGTESRPLAERRRFFL